MSEFVESEEIKDKLETGLKKSIFRQSVDVYRYVNYILDNFRSLCETEATREDRYDIYMERFGSADKNVLWLLLVEISRYSSCSISDCEQLFGKMQSDEEQ